ncbi:cell division protein FtsX [Niastella yeongjuensis]|uniref:Cell division protein FtsX n=1 Tax=Niastella yeongjuensis TaxID=354355 RepID=A0A1V9E1C4_9BACT|nr:ABC transporter permease [Niastella yeongjuensis]OQP39910.1 cell division protein FtsX [Niastella yeongjuensis]SEO09880.1 putative ABC transport system permease protein [Niastella yeongjuensis]
MLRNYIKIALRNLWKSKGFSAINIIGLAIGLATCLLIMLFVIDELSYDRYNKKADRIYRVDGDIKFGGNHFILAVAPDPMGSTLKKDYPQVEQYVRFRDNGGLLLKKGNENVQEDKVIYADSTLFDVFTLPLLDGDPQTALQTPNSLVITATTARKYFNTTQAVGRTLLVNNRDNYKITGVIKDIPAQSHFTYDFFVSMSTLEESRRNNWVSNNFNTYVVLKEGSDPKKLEVQFDALIDKYVGPAVKQIMSIDMAEFKKSGNYEKQYLTPLTSIHLYSDKTGELAPNSSIQYVYIFSAIAFFILLIACVNFMNLSTARSANRAREVGVRKVLGSLKANLVKQFLTESILISCIALVLALALTFIMLPTFNHLAAKEIKLNLLATPWLLPILLAMVLVTGLLAGSYPAFYLSSFKPIQVIKGKLAAGFKTSWLRSGLVVFQFSISIILIIATIVIYKQLNFIQSHKTGFNREQVLVLHSTLPLGSKAKTFREEVVKISGVENATMTGYLPTNGWRNDNPVFADPTLDQKKAVSMQTWDVDDQYLATLGMELTTGRNFSREFLTDSSAIIINEAAAKMYGFTDPIGKNLYYLRDIGNKNVSVLHVIGIVKDFNFTSFRQQVRPLALLLGENAGNTAIRINSTNIPHLVAQIENLYNKMAPGEPFNYTFMDEDFNNLYRTEQRMGIIAISFSALAILIACLGLFGLAAYAAEQRTKEIGIRKVLGATVSNITTMLSKDFLKLVIVSAVIAFPLAWWFMHSWLQDFAYRTTISWWVFIMAGVAAALIAVFTVSFQTIRAALMNPVKSLRNE